MIFLFYTRDKRVFDKTRSKYTFLYFFLSYFHMLSNQHQQRVRKTESICIEYNKESKNTANCIG